MIESFLLKGARWHALLDNVLPLFLTLFIANVPLGFCQVASESQPDAYLHHTPTLGRVLGSIQSGSVVRFAGIPYGETTWGKNRWKEPVAACYTRHEGLEFDIDARRYGSACPQISTAFTNEASLDEHCLFLNIWVPKELLDRMNSAPDSHSNLPVLVFVHGGGFVLGSGADPYIDGSIYAENEAILVSFNYRLGALGFFGHPVLTQKNPEAPTNFGLLDQKLALRWVRRVIAEFGGDQSSITVFGESAGAISILWLMSSIETEGQEKLFDRAIIQSGLADLPDIKLNHAEQVGITILEKLAWPTATTHTLEAFEWLSFVSSEAILNAFPGFGVERMVFWHSSNTLPYVPVIDGVQFPDNPIKILESGNYWAREGVKELIIGTTRNEGTLNTFMTFPLWPLSEKFFEEIVTVTFHNEQFGKAQFPKDILGHYTIEEFGGPMDRLSEIVGDLYFQCGSNRAALVLSNNGHRVYRYVFDHTPEYGNTKLKATHASELPFVFHTTQGGFILASNFTAEEEQFSRRIVHFWVEFARTGRIAEDIWPIYQTLSSKVEKSLRLTLPHDQIIENFKHKSCAVWKKIFPE